MTVQQWNAISPHPRTGTQHTNILVKVCTTDFDLFYLLLVHKSLFLPCNFTSPLTLCWLIMMKNLYWNFKSRNVWNWNWILQPHLIILVKRSLPFKCQEKLAKCVAGFQRRKSKHTHCLAFTLQIYFSILWCSIQNSKRPVWWNHHRLKIDQIQENLHVLKSEETVWCGDWGWLL